tara:strand:- start:61 stop:537 length:477 start_codon:yes stop_codon:yes gene_type:complete
MSEDLKNKTTRWFLETDEVVFTGPRDPEELRPLCLGAGTGVNQWRPWKNEQNNQTDWSAKIHKQYTSHLGDSYGYNSQGYIMPCCWSVQEKGSEEEQFKPLMKDKFHISNVDKIEDVFQSEEWKEFVDTLVKKPQNAAKICWHFCGRKNNNYSKEHKY